MAGAAFLGLVVASACGGGSPPLTPTQPPGSTPTSTATPVDLDAADRLYHDGDFEEAVALYSRAAASGTQTQRSRALWSLARAQYSLGRTPETEQALSDLLDLPPPPDEEARAYLFLGEARFSAGDNAGADGAFRRYLDSGGPAAPYARLRLAEIAARKGDWPVAVAGAKVALAADLPAGAATDASFALARYQEGAGDDLDALATYQGLVAGAPSAYDRGQALWRLAQVARRGGDEQLYRDSLSRLVSDMPWHAQALAALDEAQFAPTAAQRATVLFEHRMNAEATAAFRSLLDSGPGAEEQALAHYHLGVLAERAADPDGALAEYEAALSALGADTSNELFAQASWDRATVLEGHGRLQEALDAYAGVADSSPQAGLGPESLFRAGLIAFQLGLMGQADQLWGRYLGYAGDAESEAWGQFWLARAALQTGDSEATGQHLAAAAAAAPLDYYGLRAGALIARDTPRDAGATLQPPAPSWTDVEAWLTSWAGPEDPPTRQELFDGAAWRRGVELARAGLGDKAAAEFEALLDGVAGQPWLQYRLARALSEEGQVATAARAAARLAGGRADAPRPLLSLAYPSEYLGLATEGAAGQDGDPLLLLALVRQESFFDPRATSSAGALGLTQVVPATAGEIARDLGQSDFQDSDLFRPRVSLRFGAHYLSKQLDLFDGATWAALAAYNGGPGNAQRWDKAAEGDADLFLETIDFAETRKYVKFVLENYALYRYTYGLTSEPSLPLP
ncbi:MAG TPA: transglycosylase SLT domain-containing protein [Dehalococcoidia bacterium]|nr:transglycosylase SLT domain-containing protein [Dehalococcoidia bacterium]